LSFKRTLILLSLTLLGSVAASAQSTDQSYPSPVTENEVSGKIMARDVGDSRLTNHFWVFDGSQGDIFINVVTQNFSGDIDVYQASSLKPLTKMVMFADSGVTETGRVIYMRQPGRLLLRVEGRSPNDDPASYTIKFAGSFVALAPGTEVKPPTVAGTEDTGIRVNSVGTIVAVKPKAPPEPSAARQEQTEGSIEAVPDRRANVDAKSEEPTSDKQDAEDQAVKTVFSNRSAKVTTSKVGRTSTPKKVVVPPVRRTDQATRSTASTVKRNAEPQPDPMANVHLVILLKDGDRIEKVMSEVLRFSYDRGFLTVIAKDGGITRYSMVNVASVTVQ